MVCEPCPPDGEIHSSLGRYRLLIDDRTMVSHSQWVTDRKARCTQQVSLNAAEWCDLQSSAEFLTQQSGRSPDTTGSLNVRRYSSSLVTCTRCSFGDSLSMYCTQIFRHHFGPFLFHNDYESFLWRGVQPISAGICTQFEGGKQHPKEIWPYVWNSRLEPLPFRPVRRW